MKWFLGLTTRGKLFAGFGLIIVFLATVIVTAYLGITAIQASQKRLYQEDFANAMDLMALRAEQNGVRVALLNMMLLARQSDREIWQQDIKRRSKQIAAVTSQLLERNRNDPRVFARLEELKTIREAFARTRDDQLIPLIYANKTDDAKALAVGIQEERYGKMRAIAQELGDAAVEHARAAVAESELRAAQTVRLFAIVGVVAMGLGLAMVLFLNRIIAAPLRAISGIAGRVAAGDLTADLPADRRA
ncbi:MAG: MCP four helix bundle domain-containing protein, partial [Pseudomonadota bacterium]